LSLFLYFHIQCVSTNEWIFIYRSVLWFDLPYPKWYSLLIWIIEQGIFKAILISATAGGYTVPGTPESMVLFQAFYCKILYKPKIPLHDMKANSGSRGRAPVMLNLTDELHSTAESHTKKETPVHWVVKLIFFFFFFLSAQQPRVGQALLIHEVSRSHTTTHHVQ